MSTVTTSGPLTPGQGVTMPAPQIAAGVQLAAVQLQNLSGYQLAVTIGPNAYVLPPYMADVYRLTPQTAAAGIAFTVTDTMSSPASVPAYANATWLGPDELPDPSAYPATISAPAYAIGLAVSQQLLSQGVPNVLTSTNVAVGVTIPNGLSQTFDVSKYATLLVLWSGGTTGSVSYDFRDASNNIYDQDFLVAASTRLQVSGPLIRIYNNSGADLTLYITGTNRTAPYRYDAREDTAGQGWQFTIPSTAMVSNTVYPFQPKTGGILHGPVWVNFELESTAVTGWLQYQIPGGNRVIVSDTSTGVTPGGTRRINNTLCAVPPGVSWSFVCSGTGGTTSALLSVIPFTL